MTDLSDKQRVEIAKQQYAEHEVGSIVTIDNDKIKIGYVAEVIHNDKTGEHTYILTTEKLSMNHKDLDRITEVIVLYRGSTEPFGGTDWTTDWFNNQQSLDKQQSENKNGTLSQLESASETLKQAMERYSHAKFDIYGHSHGSMNGQYAVSDSLYPERIRSAYLYEGQNVYAFLNERQQINADRLRKRIYNYIDEHDLIAIGYGTDKAVGIVIRIDSKNVGSAQHMWGGYQFDKEGNIIVPTETHLEVKLVQTELRIVDRLEQLSIAAAKLQGRGVGLTSPQEIFLNSHEALIVLEGATNLVEIGFSEIIKQYQGAILEVEEHWQRTKHLSHLVATNLTEAEVLTALAEGGATQTSMVDIPILYFEMMIAKAIQIQSKYEGLIVHIKSIIKGFEDFDQELGKELRR